MLLLTVSSSNKGFHIRFLTLLVFYDFLQLTLEGVNLLTYDERRETLRV